MAANGNQDYVLCISRSMMLPQAWTIISYTSHSWTSNRRQWNATLVMGGCLNRIRIQLGSSVSNQQNLLQRVWILFYFTVESGNFLKTGLCFCGLLEFRGPSLYGDWEQGQWGCRDTTARYTQCQSLMPRVTFGLWLISESPSRVSRGCSYQGLTLSSWRQLAYKGNP